MRLHLSSILVLLAAGLQAGTASLQQTKHQSFVNLSSTDDLHTEHKATQLAYATCESVYRLSVESWHKCTSVCADKC